MQEEGIKVENVEDIEEEQQPQDGNQTQGEEESNKQEAKGGGVRPPYDPFANPPDIDIAIDHGVRITSSLRKR